MSTAAKKYAHIAKGGKRQVELTQEEECAVLFAYDYGIDNLSQDDQLNLDRVIAKLKDEIWP